jgi:hypothetical protein
MYIDQINILTFAPGQALVHFKLLSDFSGRAKEL